MVAIGLIVLVVAPAGAVYPMPSDRRLLRATPGAERSNALPHDAVAAPIPGGTDDPSVVGATRARATSR